MKIETMPEVSEQSLNINGLLTIELRKIGEDYLEVRLIPHYEKKTYLVVHDIDGSSKIIHLPEANQVILNYILENKIGTA